MQTNGPTDAEREWRDIEAIKRLKARYFRFLDQKLWDDWGALFGREFTALYQGPHPDIVFGSGAELVAMNRELLASAPTVHHGHTPDISLTGPDTASGCWAMYDRVEMAGNAFEGWGYYDELYRREDGEWKFHRIVLTRLKIVPLQVAG